MADPAVTGAGGSASRARVRDAGNERRRDHLRPALRAVRWGGAYQLARLRACLPAQRGAARRPVAFVIGCGRSGTTLMGELLGGHPGVDYLFEPFHRWAAIDPRADATGIYARHAEASCLLDGSDWTQRAQHRFTRLFMSHGGRRARGSLLVEKSPINSLRIGYLERLVPDALYVHMIRDGGAVASSIERLAVTGRYRIALRNPYNQWWGVADKKWRLLSAEMRAHGYVDEGVEHLTNNVQRGACEWVYSLSEIERWRSSLGSRLLDVHYEDLVSDPAGQLERVAVFLGLDVRSSWLHRAVASVHAPRPSAAPVFQLPPSVSERYRGLGQSYGYDVQPR